MASPGLTEASLIEATTLAMYRVSSSNRGRIEAQSYGSQAACFGSLLPVASLPCHHLIECVGGGMRGAKWYSARPQSKVWLCNWK